MAITGGGCGVVVATSTTISKTKTGFNPTVSQQSYKSSVDYTSIGNGANAFDQLYQALRTINANTSETLDLYGSLVNDLNETINFVRIKSILIEMMNAAVNSSTGILVGNSTNTQFNGPISANGTESVVKGGIYFNGRSDATGWPVVNSSSDLLKIANADNTNAATYRITLIGATS